VVARKNESSSSHDRTVTRLKTAWALQSITMSERLDFGTEVDDIRRRGFEIGMLEEVRELE